TSAWLREARALVPLAAVFALGTAVTAGWFDGTRHEFSHWFLLPSAALVLAFYSVEAVARRERYALWIAAATIAALTCSVVFGTRLAPEHYALALIAAGAACYAAGRFGLLRLPAALGYESIRRDAMVVAQLIVAAGVAYAILSVSSAADPDSAYVQQTSWSLLLAFGSAAIFFTVNLLARDAATKDEVVSALGFALTLTGALTAVVYGAGWRAEYYAFAFAAAALALLAVSLPAVRSRLPLAREHDALQIVVAVAHAAALTAGCVMVGSVYAHVSSSTTFALQTRWTAVALPGALALFYAAASLAQPRDLLPRRELSFGAMLASLYAAALATVFALGVSVEYYAFALIVPAIGLALVERPRSTRLDALLPRGYDEQLMDAGRIGVVAGIAVALGAVAAGTSTEIAYRPQSGVFLPVAFAFAAAFFALDASRKPRYATSAALLASLVAVAIGVTYAAGAGAPWYGVTLAATGIALALVRPLAPRWLDAGALSHAAVIPITASWLGFEGVYVDYPRIAAGVHLAAAVFYAFAAFNETRTVALEARREDGSEAMAMPLALAWLWASGLALAIGYVHALRGVAFGQDAAAAYSYPMLGFALAMVAAAIAVRRGRPAFTSHMYAMALLADIAAIATAGGAHDLALLLTISAVLSVALAVYEDEPAIAVPAVAFGFGAVAAWQRDGAWAIYVIPAIYSAIGLAAYALGFALRTSTRRWSDALRAAGGLYAIVAPAAGFVALSNGTHHGLYGAAGFESSALYQWSTLGIALTGLLALVESSFARRGWVVIAGSGVLVVSLMLELGRFGVRDAEAYTAVTGLYLLLVGTLGLWRFRLVPEAADMAPLVEVLGAATILVPSAVRALHGGWGQLAVLLAEASAFLLLGAMLRRRGLLAAALTTFVVVAVRVLFDAAQALPNWIIVLIAGMALLGIGMAILLGRERWSRIEKALLGWWDAMNAPEQHNGDAAHG
ncbi:MAG TPA: hypothetical protein VFY79_00805, partial [Dehalococcoidia bacterium]|nr:hypothetical protein [Dehalococcoidia bacterium]